LAVLKTINEATNDSRRLSGTAKNNNPGGNTSRFHNTTHISTKPTNHDISAVITSEYFLEKMKTATANSSDHIPQTAPLTGADGKTIPRDS
jgi:hypothetical protein